MMVISTEDNGYFVVDPFLGDALKPQDLAAYLASAGLENHTLYVNRNTYDADKTDDSSDEEEEDTEEDGESVQ